MKRLAACGALAFLIFGASSVSAQYSYNMPNPMASYSMGLMNNVMISAPLYQQMKAMDQKAGNQSPSRGQGAPQPPAPRSLGFSPGDGAETVNAYAERVAKQDPEAARQFRAAFAGKNVSAIFGQIVAADGLTNHDVADAMAARLIMRAMVATGGSEPSPQRLVAIRGAIARGLAHDPRIASQAYRSQLGSEAQLDFVVTNAAWRAISQGSWPADAAAQYRRNAAASLAREGVDLKALGLDPGAPPR
jgi:hypothetical protein